ncbi:MAG TPA: exodeoxyribonuclease VII small subunit [Dehalococcoidia bacterium]
MAKESKQTESFEQLYARLEEMVAKLEQGGLPLEQSIALYEEGMALAHQCQARLDEAELKITKLKESFAPVERQNGRQLNDAHSDDYEYVGEDTQESDADDPFA